MLATYFYSTKNSFVDGARKGATKKNRKEEKKSN